MRLKIILIINICLLFSAGCTQDVSNNTLSGEVVNLPDNVHLFKNDAIKFCKAFSLEYTKHKDRLDPDEMKKVLKDRMNQSFNTDQFEKLASNSEMFKDFKNEDQIAIYWDSLKENIENLTHEEWLCDDLAAYYLLSMSIKHRNFYGDDKNDRSGQDKLDSDAKKLCDSRNDEQDHGNLSFSEIQKKQKINLLSNLETPEFKSLVNDLDWDRAIFTDEDIKALTYKLNVKVKNITGKPWNCNDSISSELNTVKLTVFDRLKFDMQNYSHALKININKAGSYIVDDKELMDASVESLKEIIHFHFKNNSKKGNTIIVEIEDFSPKVDGKTGMLFKNSHIDRIINATQSSGSVVLYISGES